MVVIVYLLKRFISYEMINILEYFEILFDTLPKLIIFAPAKKPRIS